MIALIGFLILVGAAALVGGQFPPGTWYAGLAKPSWTPPNWLFAPVWTVLYIAIALAGWLVWRSSSTSTRSRIALMLWSVQLLLNVAWSGLFFGLHRPDLALADLILMLGAILGFIVVARPANLLAAALFVPYALWVGFATFLNLAIVWLNRSPA